MTEPSDGHQGTRPLPPTEDPPAAERPPRHAGVPPDTGRTGRFWSARRVPAGCVALALLIVSGALLYDIAAVRAGRQALAWREESARRLAEHPLDDGRVLLGAAAVTLIGGWLILLALTPGLRSLLTLRSPDPGIRAALRRDAAATVLRARALDVPGVRSARVRMRRRRAVVRVVAHFREPAEVRADLDRVLGESVAGLGLVRRPTLAVRVDRAARKG
ncbi:DUF6286 domain-containing protein [Streptomyces sp. ZYX-F-203]